MLLVPSIFERLGDLHSLETRTDIQRFLSEPPGSDLGVGLESVLSLLRTVSMVAAGLATAAAILGYHVLKRNRGAHGIGLGVLAIPLFLCGLMTGGFLASVVAASVAMLWLQPSRSWLRAVTSRHRTTRTTRRRVERRPTVGGTRPGRATLRATCRCCPARAARGRRRAARRRRPGRRTPPASLGSKTPASRPGSLVTACVVTWARARWPRCSRS